MTGRPRQKPLHHYLRHSWKRPKPLQELHAPPNLNSRQRWKSFYTRLNSTHQNSRNCRKKWTLHNTLLTMQPTPQKVKKLKAFSTEFPLNSRNKLRLVLISKQDTKKQRKRQQPPRQSSMTSKRSEESIPLRPVWTQAHMTHQQVKIAVSSIEPKLLLKRH